MDHKLRLVLRLDADLQSAVFDLRGCLTVPAVAVLRRLFLNSRALNDQLTLSLDLRAARHIEPAALAALNLDPFPPVSATGADPVVHTTLDRVGPLKVLFPPVWPICPVEKALTARCAQSTDVTPVGKPRDRRSGAADPGLSLQIPGP